MYSLQCCILLIVGWVAVTSNPVQGQTYREGSVLLEPLVGFMTGGSPENGLNTDVTFISWGGRLQWYRSYRSSLLAEVLNMSSSEADLSWTMASLSYGSTLVDRDATGWMGVYLTAGLGLGFVKTSETPEKRNWMSLLAPFSCITAFEVSRKIVIRLSATIYIGFIPDGGMLWFTGLGLVPGVGVVF